jgi:hypothetical protein
MPADIPKKIPNKSNLHAASFTFSILDAAWEGKSWNFRFREHLQIAHASMNQPQPHTIVSPPGLPS